MMYKDVKGYEGIYVISRFGNVYSLRRTVYESNGKPKRINQKLMRPGGGNYLSVLLSKNGKAKTHYIHRLVANHFLDKPDYYCIVNHINGNKHDNRAENLEWVTPSENNYHAYRTGLMNGNHKKKIVLDTNTGVYYDSAKQFAELYGMNASRVTNWLNGSYNSKMPHLIYV